MVETAKAFKFYYMKSVEHDVLYPNPDMEDFSSWQSASSRIDRTERCHGNNKSDAEESQLVTLQGHDARHEKHTDNPVITRPTPS